MSFESHIKMSAKRERKSKEQRLVYSQNNEKHTHQNHEDEDIKPNRCDIDYQRGTFQSQRLKSNSTMKRNRGFVRPAFSRSVKIFILVGVCANLYSFLSEHPLLLEVEAGSKSKASSKTTVIAIDGGGGGHGHPQPVPVPWPVVHCHHHHHHLKYVPKPILVHHWIKKHKAPTYEIAASDNTHALELGTDPHVIEQPLNNNEFVNPLALPSSLPDTYNNADTSLNGLPGDFSDTNRMVSGISSVFDDNPSNQPPSHQMPMTFPSTSVTSRDNPSPSSSQHVHRVQPKPKLSTSIGSELERELKKLQVRKKLHDVVNNSTNKHLKKITNTILANGLNLKKHFGNDADSDDSFMNVAVVNTSGASIASNLSEALTTGSASSVNKTAYRGNGVTNLNLQLKTPLKPTASSNQAKFESRRGSSSLSEFRKNLEIANRMEQSQTTRQYEKLASEQEGRMQALNAVNRLLIAGFLQSSPDRSVPFRLQSPQLVQQLVDYGLSQSNSKPSTSDAVISSRVANALSESKTIETMIKLAEQMARTEAKRLIAEQQRKSSNKTTSRNEISGSRSLLKSLDIFGMLPQSSLRNHRNKRRRDLTMHPLYDSALSNFKIGRLHSKPMASRFIAEPAVIRSFNLVPSPNGNYVNRARGPVSGLIANHFDGDQLMTQSSNSVNKIVEPTKDVKLVLEQNIGKSLGANGNTVNFGPAIQDIKKAKQEEFNSIQTTMNPMQEDEFYLGQQSHLMRTNQHHMLPLLSGSNQTKVYKSLPSDLHKYIVEAPSQTLEQVEGLNGQMNSLISVNPQPDLFPAFAQQPSLQQSQLAQNQLIEGWNQQRKLRSVGEIPPQPVAQNADEASQTSSMTTSEGGRLYQNFAESMVPMPSYLEFPMSPQHWTTEAMKSINGPMRGNSSTGESEAANGEDNSKVAETSNLDSNEAHAEGNSENQHNSAYDVSNNQLGNNLLEHKVVVEELTQAPQNLHQFSQPNLFQTPDSFSTLGYQPNTLASSMNPQQQQSLLAANQPGPLFAEQNGIPLSGVGTIQNPSYMFNTPAGAPFYPPMYPILNPSFTAKSGKETLSQPENGGLMQSSLRGQTFQTSEPKSLGSGFRKQQSQYDPMEVATADMKQLTQFQNALSQSAGPTNNLTSMTRFSRQIRDQMNTLQGRLPQMPNIPNIPQPPQLPNLPMPPPGMMQMAGLALPFAMARATRQANRVRDQRVNAAANGGGAAAPTTTSQRLFNRALTLTNRLSRPRPRPSSAPASSSSNGAPPRNRNRIMGLVQTVVDMSRRPSPGITIPSAGSSNRLFSSSKPRPKVDEEVSDIRAKRLGRAAAFGDLKFPHERKFNLKRTGGKSTVILPNSMLTAVTDGSLARFASMTSPVDILTQQLAQRQRQSHEPQETDSGTHHYEVIDERPAESHGSMVNGLIPVPVVANHFNLLMFTAQNVTGHLLKPSETSVAGIVGSHSPEQLPSQQQPEAAQESGSSGEVEGSTESNPIQQQDQEQSEERQHLAQESKLQQNPGQPSTVNIKPYGERSSRPEGKLHHTAESSRPAVTVISEMPTQADKPTLSLFTTREKGPNKKESLTQTTVSANSKIIEQEEQRTEASVVAPVMQARDSFFPVTTTSTQAPVSGDSRQLMQLISMTQLEHTTRPTLALGDSHRRRDLISGLSRFNKANRSPAKSMDKKIEVVKAGARVELTQEDRPTPVVQAAILNPTTNAITTMSPTTDRPTPETSTPPPDDYVRAIKLVRGVAYPWPPPTKSSTMLRLK